jgi:ankyrin repeat protein
MSTANAARPLPPHPDLDQYRKQARELLRALQRKDSEAAARFQASHPRDGALPRPTSLADAQFVIAREHGYASWPKFKAAIEALALDRQGRAGAFVEAAIRNQLAEAQELLVQNPSLPTANIAAAAVYGDSATMARLLAGDPTLAARSCGPRGRVPLLYATESAFITVPERQPGIRECVRLLLAHGADPNVTFQEEPWPEFPIPPLYGAAGRYNDAEIATILIDAGARLDDGESLYHSVEHHDHRCTRLLLERGANASAPNVLAHQLDYDDLAGLTLLLDYGSNPNVEAPHGGTALHWAVRRRREPEFIRLLLQHGADPNARDPHGMPAYRIALRTGQGEVAGLLRTEETEREVTAIDRLIGAAAAGDFARIELLKRDDPEVLSRLSAEDHAVVALAVESGDLDQLRSLLQAGFSPNGRGTSHGTALHWAAWFGMPEAVRLLLEHGAELEACGAHMGSTPLQWAVHGSGHNAEASQEQFFAVIDLLLAAGASFGENGLATGSREVKERYGPGKIETGIAAS